MADNLDQAGEEQLRRRLDDALTAGCVRLEVDCSAVRRVERPSLTALSAVKERLEARGGSLVVTAPSAAFVWAATQAGFRGLVGDRSASGRGPRTQATGLTR